VNEKHGLPLENQIPKRIIQTGKQARQPLRNRVLASNMRLLNTDYEYLFFDDEAVSSFVSREFPQYRQTFDSFPYAIQKYDFFRYLAVYLYGGFYFDLDVLIAAKLESLRATGCVFPFEGLTFSQVLRSQYNMDWQIGNYAFGAAAGHPFLKTVIENCIQAQKDPSLVQSVMKGSPFLSRGEFYILNTTGPGLISRTLAENPELARTVTVLFPDDVCDVANWNSFGEFGLHLMDGSWRMKRGWLGRRLAQVWEGIKLQRVLKQSRQMGKTRAFVGQSQAVLPQPPELEAAPSNLPLVSILIPAYNAQQWIADTLRSATAQTWPRKEIIVVDDGSSDGTLAVAKQFEGKGVRVVTQKNQGAAAARNTAFSLSHGDYIQWLDADDILAPNKVELQMEAAMRCEDRRMVFSSSWGKFMHRQRRAAFTRTDLWCDLSPVEWLLRKMEQNIYMQTATWLVSRELSEEAGPWNTQLLGDDDGEYFCRVLLASKGTKFVPEARVYYRTFGYDSLGYIGLSDRKCQAHWLSMGLHIGYLRSRDDSRRARAACLRYLRNSLIFFYPEKTEIVRQVEELSQELGEPVGTPSLSWKYAWAKALFGWNFAKHMQVSSRKMRWQVEKVMDKLLLLLEGEKPGASKGSPQGESSNLFRLRSTDASSQTTGGE
jgi:glycosyltransferase involved in cell wall biosynthesis